MATTNLQVHTDGDWDAEVLIHDNPAGGKWLDINFGPQWVNSEGVNAKVQVTLFAQSTDHLRRLTRSLRAALSEEVA